MNVRRLAYIDVFPRGKNYDRDCNDTRTLLAFLIGRFIHFNTNQHWDIR